VLVAGAAPKYELAFTDRLLVNLLTRAGRSLRPSARGGYPLMATYTVDLFTTLDGFGSGPVAYWGQGRPRVARAAVPDLRRT